MHYCAVTLETVTGVDEAVESPAVPRRLGVGAGAHDFGPAVGEDTEYTGDGVLTLVRMFARGTPRPPGRGWSTRASGTFWEKSSDLETRRDLRKRDG